MLAAEDYMLVVSTVDGGPVRLAVEAGPGACSYCLVPMATLRQITLDHLSKAGLPIDLDIEITYPED